VGEFLHCGFESAKLAKKIANFFGKYSQILEANKILENRKPWLGYL
jgi:hypothetical protein